MDIFGGFEPYNEYDDWGYYENQEWHRIGMLDTIRARLRTYRDKNNFTSYSEALEYLISKGLPSKKRKSKDLKNSKNCFMDIWVETYHKLLKMCEKGKYNFICNLIDSLLIDCGE